MPKTKDTSVRGVNKLPLNKDTRQIINLKIRSIFYDKRKMAPIKDYDAPKQDAHSLRPR